MSGALRAIAEHGLPAALAAVRAAGRRVEHLARSRRGESPERLLAAARRELSRAEPALARAITNATIAGWLAAARGPAKDAAPVLDRTAELPPPPEPPISVATLFQGEPDPLIRFPAVEAAARDLLARRVVTPDRYAGLSGEAKRAAFTVARALTEDAVGAVRDAVLADVAGGGTLRQFRRAVAGALADSRLSDSQVEGVYRTQVGQAQAAGLRAVLDHPAVADEFPYLRYVATHDARARPDHLAMERMGLNGTAVYRADDPVIRRFFPPWAWNCRCVAIPLTVEDAAALGVREARRWLRTGEPPEKPAWVAWPPFDLPAGWVPNTGAVRAVV